MRAPSDWKAVLTWPNPPSVSLSAFLWPIEGDRWMVTIVDYHQAAHLETWNSFLAALKQLITPTIYEAVRSVTPPEIWNYGYLTNLWRHFEQLPRLPRGVLPIGDSLCRFNPIDGQGMSVAAQQAGCFRFCWRGRLRKRSRSPQSQSTSWPRSGSLIKTSWLSQRPPTCFSCERPQNLAESQHHESPLFRAPVATP